MESEDGNYILYGESTLLILLFIAGLATNIPVLIVYFRSKHIRSITDKFLLNLLIADLISVTLLFPSILLNFIQYSSEEYDFKVYDDSQTIISPQLQGTDSSGMGQNHFYNGSRTQQDVAAETFHHSPNNLVYWNWSCGVNNGLLAGLATASVFAALEIAMERYLAVVKPLHYHKFLTTPSIFIASLIGGLLSIATAVISSFDPTYTVFPDCMKGIQNLAVFSQLHGSSLNGTIGHRLNRHHHKDQLINPSTSHFFHEKQYTDAGYRQESQFWLTHHELVWPIYSLIHVTVFFILPVILMTFIYITIYLEARRQKIKMTKQFKPYFVPVAPNKINSERDSKGKSKFHPIFIRFKLMDRLRATKIDRAARVAVFTLFVTILCWSPYYFLRSIRAIMRISGSPSIEEVSLDDGQYLQEGELSKNSRWTIWTSVFPLFFASLHPILAPIFYAYRYKRLRTEIMKTVCDPISLFTDHDKANRLDTKTNKGFSTNSTSGGTPCIRQAIITHREKSSIIITPAEENIVQNEIETCNDPNNFARQTTLESNFEHSQTCIDFYPENTTKALNNDLVCINLPPESTLEDNNDGLVIAHSTNSNINSITGQVVVPADRSVGNLVTCLTVWMNSYSRRWLSHRESVTSTASFITLLSSKYHSKTHPVSNV